MSMPHDHSNAAQSQAPRRRGLSRWMWVLVIALGLSPLSVPPLTWLYEHGIVPGQMADRGWGLLYDESMPQWLEWADTLLIRCLFEDCYEAAYWGPDPILEADFRRVAGIHTVDFIHLQGCEFNGEWLAYLSGHPSLMNLWIEAVLIDDHHLSRLKDIPHLTSLSLALTPISDEGMKHLASLDKLLALNLSGTNVTDAGLRHLSQLPRLQSIDLTGTPVTDAGAGTLSSMTTLHTVSIDKGKWSQQAITSLTSRNPPILVHTQ